MNHAEYIDHVRQYFDEKAGDEEFLTIVEAHQKELLTLASLNLDPVMPVLGYHPYTRVNIR